jgi:hypothetical protein
LTTIQPTIRPEDENERPGSPEAGYLIGDALAERPVMLRGLQRWVLGASHAPPWKRCCARPSWGWFASQS